MKPTKEQIEAEAERTFLNKTELDFEHDYNMMQDSLQNAFVMGAEYALTHPSADGEAAGWIAVSDEMPEDGESVLCYSPKYGNPNDVFSAIVHNKNNDGRFQNGTSFYWAGTEVSHWMPLPSPPSPEKQSEEKEQGEGEAEEIAKEVISKIRKGTYEDWVSTISQAIHTHTERHLRAFANEILNIMADDIDVKGFNSFIESYIKTHLTK